MTVFRFDINICDLYIIPINTEINSLKLASSLRREGLRVIVELNKRKVKIEELNRELNRVNGCLYEKETELNSIKDSKRWKVVNNIVNKIRKVVK